MGVASLPGSGTQYPGLLQRVLPQFQNYNYQGFGQLDDLITPAIDLGTSDSASLSFEVAYGVYDVTDVSNMGWT